jgi:gliding motility-associated-like protein
MKKFDFNSKSSSRALGYLLQIFLLLGIAMGTNAQIRVPFTQRTSQYTPTKKIYNVKGDFTMIGNTNMTLQNYGNQTQNGNNTMVYVDVDGTSNNGVDGKPTFNSSSSTLTFSTENGAVPSCSNIIYAGLYWTGRSSDSNPSNNSFSVTKNINGTSVTKNFDKRNISLKGPNAATYTEFTASASDIYYPTTSDGFMYSAYKEVTDYVRANGIGEYTAADLALNEGNGGGTGFYGGWSLIVVYENSKMKYRDVTIFDGHAYVTGGTASFEIPVSGFNTVQSGPVGVKLGLMAGEGDSAISGDYFEIRRQSDNAFLRLNHAGNTTGNFFNSAIQTGGNPRNPTLSNNTGLDISMFNIPNANNSVLTNNQTSTTFRYGSTQDTYVIFAIAMAVDAYIPEVENILTTTSINNVPVTTEPYTSLPGQDVGFNIDIKNLGTEAINNYTVVVPIPYNASYVPGSAVGTILFTPLPTPNTVSFDPTAGATGSIVWNIGTLPIGVTPDQLLAKLSFKLTTTTDCSILLNPTCGSPIFVTATSNGTGAITGIQFAGTRAIKGYTNNGTCIGQPILETLAINISGANYVDTNCQNTPLIRNFGFCDAASTIGTSAIAANFPPGSAYYNEFPVTINSIQYSDVNPFPLVAGSTVTYYALPPNTTGCFFPFTISKCKVIDAINDSIGPINGATGNTNAGNVLSNNGNGIDTLGGNQVLLSQVNLTVVTPASPINGGLVPFVDLTSGNIVVPAGTPAGVYTIVYQICEKITPTNCDSATVTICVGAAPISGGDQVACQTSPTQTLTASASAPGQTIVWYDALTDGNIVASPTLNTVGTVTYYAQANVGNCSFSTRTPVTLTINAAPAAPTVACYETATFNNTSCAWEVTGTMPVEPTVACYETANFNTTSCAWEVTGTMPVEPTVACYETANFNTTSCAWEVTGTMPVEPTVACYETANFNTTSCAWEVTGTMPVEPTVACYETATFNNTSCAWEVTGTMPVEPTVACYETANFNNTSCAWEVTGTMPVEPTVACYETANFNTTSCAWEVTGTMPVEPTVACYETANFNNTSCAWEVTGTMPVEPTVACYETANFNTTSCAWEVTGTMPVEPTVACYETATFNNTSCAWEVTGTMPVEPTVACYETATFNTTSCAWEVTGTIPVEPTVACYETANFNTTSCAWEVTGTMPVEPTVACYETANFNNTSCAWEVTGTMPVEPTVACYETANFNTTSCAWEVTGTMPVEPTVACYETANFNNTSCAWEVTGTMPVEPTVACYETANFNTTSCAWEVTGTMPVEPTVACYETANFNNTSCAWEVTGTMPVEPTVACYETANFNNTSCAWEVTGTMPVEPTVACYETANFNTTSCAWEVTGTMPVEPTVACYETANFNTTSCAWEVTGTMPVEPTVACYETATFNNTSCAWEVTGTMPVEPTVACYETATFNTTSCAWEVTGTMPVEPTVACYETATFNTTSCAWEVTGTIPVEPTVACYEVATFNPSTCLYDVTGSQPPAPSAANCWDNFVFNNTTCVWDNQGTQPAQPAIVNCWDNFVFNNTTCVWDNQGTQPAQPAIVNCWDNFVFNNTTCVWDNEGTQPAQPAIVNCWDNFVFNNTTCVWDNEGTQPAQPAIVNCWDSFVFNTTTCAWNNTGSQDPQPPVVNCWDNFVFNTTTCAWNNTGSQDPQPPVVNCWDNFVFNTTTCAWNNTGSQDPQPPVVNCWDNFVFNTTTCAWNNTGSQDPQPPVVNCWDNFVFNTTTCAWNNTGSQDPQPPVVNCWDNFVFNNTTCVWDNTGVEPVQLTINSSAADCNNDAEIKFDLNTFLPTGTPLTGSWSTGNSSANGGLVGSEFSPYQIEVGTYLFSYDFIDAGGCAVKVDLNMTVDDECAVLPTCSPLLVYNAFSPNGDGVNELFIIEQIDQITCYPTNTVEIYNRWGILVYDTKQYDNENRVFKGISEGRATVAKGEDLPTGTYFYVIEYTDSDGNNKRKEGYLFLTQ